MENLLKKTRTDAGITIEQVSKALNIRKHYLEALENNCFDKLPGEVYVYGYLKLYTQYLGIEYDKLTFKIDYPSTSIIQFPLDPPANNNNYLEIIATIVTTIVLVLCISISTKYIDESYDNSLNLNSLSQYLNLNDYLKKEQKHL